MSRNRRKLPADTLIEVTVTGLNDYGEGVAHIPALNDKSALMVNIPELLPSETARVTINHTSPHEKDGVRAAWATVNERTRSSSNRVLPRCDVFGACGGCDIQHADEATQHAFKTKQVQNAIDAQQYGSTNTAVRVLDAVPSPRPWAYRNQGKYVLQNGQMGAYARRSHRVVSTASCAVVSPRMTRAAELVFDQLKTTPAGRSVKHLLVRENHEGRFLVVLVTAHPWPEGPRIGAVIANALVRAGVEVAGVVHNMNTTQGNRILGHTSVTLWGEPVIWDKIGQAKVRLGPTSFFQINREVAARAYAHIARAVSDTASDNATTGETVPEVPAETTGDVSAETDSSRPIHVLDVFAGVGAIGLYLASALKNRHPDLQVTAVEENPECQQHAEAAAREMGLENYRFVTGDATARISAEVDTCSPDVIVLNPPRAGCTPEVLQAVKSSPARLVAYLSCNPKTLARDLAVLAQEPSLSIGPVTPFDMLPQTAHVESLVMITRLRLR